MQTLDIECPSCGEMLELDAGFAGGVCRCSNCGTLMTVPSDAGKAESLTKPTSSASVGAGGLSSMGVPDPAPRRSSAKRGKGKKGKGKKPRRISTTIEAGEYQTASGKVIRLEETTRVPMAEGKRKKIRAATTAVFFGIVTMVVAVAVVGIIMITSGPGTGDHSEVTYNPADNPYTLTFANVMGLPVTDRTVVIVEASEYSEEWAEIVGDIIGAGLSQESNGGEIALIGAGGTPVMFGGGGLKDLPIGTGEVRGWFDKLPATGQADVAAAIIAGLQQMPDTLIVVHGYADMTDIPGWDALIKTNKDLKLHTVHIGNSSPELEGWAGERGGYGVVLSIDQIEYLKEVAAGPASEEE